MAEPHAQALRDLVETEMELCALLHERAERSRGRRSRRLWAQAYQLGEVTDRDIKRLEDAWLHGGHGAVAGE